MVVDVQTYDPDANDTEGTGLVYTLSGGEDAEHFTLDALSGELRFKEQPDYSVPKDHNADNHYQLDISVMDSLGYADTQSLKIMVTSNGDRVSLSVKVLLQGPYEVSFRLNER